MKPVPQAKALGQTEDSFTERQGMCLNLLSVQSPVGSSLPTTIHFSDCHNPIGPRNAGLPGHQSLIVKGCPLAVAAKTIALDIEIRTPALCKALPPRLRDTGTQEHSKHRL